MYVTVRLVMLHTAKYSGLSRLFQLVQVFCGRSLQESFSVNSYRIFVFGG